MMNEKTVGISRSADRRRLAAMKILRLTIMNGQFQGRDVTAPVDQEFVIGRAGTADCAVMDPIMSREHFAMVSQDGVWRIRDLDSRNGTKLNDRVVHDARVSDGDIVVAGVTRFRVNLS